MSPENPDPSARQVSNLVPGLDRVAVARWTSRRAASSPWLHEEIAARMLPRLDCFRHMPTSWLHWEPVHGGLQAHRQLCQRLSAAQSHVLAQDVAHVLQAVNGQWRPSWNPLRRKNKSGAILAGEQTRVGMLWANMVLHREPQPLALLQRWSQHVQTGGFLMFSCLGPDSLGELRALYRQRGWGEPAHGFVDMHDWGDMLVQAGFAEPVVDMERITLTYSSANAMLEELRLLGRNFSLHRFGALRGRGWHRQLLEGIESSLPRTPDGRIQLGLEVVYGHAFKPEPRLKAAPEQSVSVDALRHMLRSSRR